MITPYCLVFFFFKQKTAYEMRISDWSSDVCSSDLPRVINARHFERIKALVEDARAKGAKIVMGGEFRAEDRYIAPTLITNTTPDMKIMQEEIFEIGRASCRERVCQYV